MKREFAITDHMNHLDHQAEMFPCFAQGTAPENLNAQSEWYRKPVRAPRR